MQDTINLPNWNIFEEIKNINNHQFRKATSTFKGRNYEVWFTDEYLTMCGPWKLNGLPGLIILAQDQNREVFCEAIEKRKSKLKEFFFISKGTDEELVKQARKLGFI